MPARTLRAIGLMSGTSLDGVDAAWIETDGEHVFHFGPAAMLRYQDDLRADLRRLLDLAPGLSPDDRFLQRVEERLTRDHALAVSMTGRAADVIGFHGQTILHAPEAHRTWQIGDAVLLAHITRIPVVHDFRSADVAAGGQGAPFAPLFHAALAAALPKPLLVVNIGGVANITWLGAGGEIIACDTGPGNGPLDDLAQRHLGKPYDENGAFAASGQVDEARLGLLLGHPYFARPAPKSLDRLTFSALIAQAIEGLPPADAAATLAAFCATAIGRAPLPAPPLRVLVGGGGRHNAHLMQLLAAQFPVPVQPVEAAGWDGDALEAQCFAFLAVRSLRGLPLSLPSTTGVPEPMPGGRLQRPTL
ncbi:anhydro-N-acetylmuramic acid kinase [Acidocella sp. KAb 2-4]|uniref:anhydro-N-acetylmuramic acid kinase n=1 Tax=Acidocella sp. KAb 2-4 TaxID=2885158 RepID=UPI001D07C701|nr:anhydro-N-acetylmuramic acid kinase [Acidocella sp. KAb 2-4]MCB5943293.1 anhydro-N-acetylmuramic acid kinase [Acidocella sp. KAb 2-4]